MVTTIGIDPHKATHAAVAIDESEKVLGELTVRATRSQLKMLLEWADRVDGDGRTWAVEAAGGLGYLLSQQLVASGERVVDVPPVLASRVRVLGRAGPRRTTPTMLCRWRWLLSASRLSPRCGGRTTARSCGCWRNVTLSSLVSAPRRCVGSMRC